MVDVICPAVEFIAGDDDDPNRQLWIVRDHRGTVERRVQIRPIVCGARGRGIVRKRAVADG